MKEFVEVRVPEKWANKQFGSSLGQPMADPGQPAYVRRIVLEAGDPRLGDLERRLRGDHQKPAVMIDREYTGDQLSRAELFHLLITECFHREACGEDYGTVYSDSCACAKCGAGRVQCSPLRLDLSLARKGPDIVRTIARNELLISDKFMNVLEKHQMSGWQANEVEHSSKRSPKGRWYQLNITGKAGHTVAPTRFGINYFDHDCDLTYTCPTHLLSGLHVISEIYVARKTVDREDIAVTSNRIGLRSGVLMPTPLIVVSPSFYKLLCQNKLQGWKAEVAYMVD